MSEDTLAAMGLDDPTPLPQSRSPEGVDESEDTLYQELALVADRHNNALSHADLARALFDFADSYAEVHDIERSVDRRRHPRRDESVPLVVVPDADQSLSPVGYEIGELRNAGGVRR